MSNADKQPIVVVKVGTSSLMKSSSVTHGQAANLTNMGALVEMATDLHNAGFRVIIVTSGAVGFGCLKLKLAERPKTIALKQAMAAAGQSQLMRMYEDLFGVYGVSVAQILLSRVDFASKDRFANVLATIKELLKLRVIPIINENDTVSSGDKLRFGNNDTLSALVAVGVSAQKLFLLTDVDCLYTANPRTNPDALPIPVVTAAELATLAADSSGGEWGTGGMATKIVAARTAVCADIEVILSHGAYPTRVTDFLLAKSGEAKAKVKCTVFLPGNSSNGTPEIIPYSTMTPHRRWILALPVRGSLVLDKGACRAVANKTSLLAAGIVEVIGEFEKDDAVSLVSEATGCEIARALTSMDSSQLLKVKGLQSSEFAGVIGFEVEPEIAHRSNIVLVACPPKNEV